MTQIEFCCVVDVLWIKDKDAAPNYKIDFQLSTKLDMNGKWIMNVKWKNSKI